MMFTMRVPGTTGNACDLVTRKDREKLVFRQKIKELLEPRRPTSIPRPTAARAASRQISPKRKVSPERAKAVAAAAVAGVAAKKAAKAAGKASPKLPPPPVPSFRKTFDFSNYSSEEADIEHSATSATCGSVGDATSGIEGYFRLIGR